MIGRPWRLDVIRLLLMQRLLQPLKLTGVGMMLLSAPQQCVLFFLNAAWIDGQGNFSSRPVPSPSVRSRDAAHSYRFRST